jgi:glycosyltransferase involved in cell wall biosynthesis
LSPEKGITHILRLAELVPDVDIHVAGDGPARAAVEDAAARLPNLHYRGSIARTEVADMFGCAIAVIVPSLWEEPGAVVVLEAMAAGTPVLAYNVGGIAEYITNAGAGMVVEPQPEALAAAYATLLSDPKKWERLSRSGAVAASGAHSLDTHCTGLERVFGEAIGAER